MEISLKAEHLFNIGGLGITNGLLLALIVSAILIVFSIIFRGKIKLVPGKVQGAVEMLVEMFLGLMESVLGSKAKAEKYLPLVLSIFIFILLYLIIPGSKIIFFLPKPRTKLFLCRRARF